MANTKMDVNKFKRILNGSIRYEIERGELTITGYYTGESVTIDLNYLTDEMFEELLVEDEDDEYDDEYDDDDDFNDDDYLENC